MTYRDSQAVADWIDYGVTVEPIPADIVEAMTKEADIFYDEMAAKDPFFGEVLASKRAFQKAYRDAWPRL